MNFKKIAWVICVSFCLLSTSFLVQMEAGVKASSDNVEGWAAILDMNNFPEGWSSLPMDFINSEMVSQVLVDLGWQSDHIYVKHDNLTLYCVEEAVEWLVNNADSNDIALFYISTHGGWMRREILWNDWFPSEWQKLDTSERILMIDTCSAGEFTEPVKYDPKPHISLGHCSAGEVAWAGVEEEGLPIIGGVWTYYFVNALCNSTADSDENGFVSAEEAFDFSTSLVQRYMNETVFAVPQFLEMYHNISIYPEEYDAYPHPVMDDQYPGQLYLDLSYYGLMSDLNNDGTVNILDVSIVALAFGSTPEDPNWNIIADLNNDQIINILDISTVAKKFGKIV